MQDTSIQLVTPLRHRGLRWQSETSYTWAAAEAIVPLVGSELGKAVTQMPVAFVPRGEEFQPAAVLGLEPGVSLFVGGKGQWIGTYVPAALRKRPFMLLPTDQGERVLCVDEAAGKVKPADQLIGGEPFVSEDGKLAPAVQEILDFMAEVEVSQKITAQACAALQRHKLIVPWEITLQTEAGQRRVEGLYRVDEPAMDALDAEAFLDLRKNHALPIAYAHLISTQHLSTLAELARARATALYAPPVPVTAAGDLDLSFLESGDTLRF